MVKNKLRFKGVSVVGKNLKTAAASFVRVIAGHKRQLIVSSDNKVHAVNTIPQVRFWDPKAGSAHARVLDKELNLTLASDGTEGTGVRAFTCECSTCKEVIITESKLKHCILCASEIEDESYEEVEMDIPETEELDALEEDDELEEDLDGDFMEEDEVIEDEEDGDEMDEDDDLEFEDAEPVGDDLEEEEDEVAEEVEDDGDAMEDEDEDLEVEDEEGDALEEDEEEEEEVEEEDDGDAMEDEDEDVEVEDEEGDALEEDAPEEEVEEEVEGDEMDEEDCIDEECEEPGDELEEEEQDAVGEEDGDFYIDDEGSVNIDLVDGAELEDGDECDVEFSASMSGNKRWIASVNGLPVAYATVATAGANKEIFHTEAFGKVVKQVIAKSGLSGLKDLGFASIIVAAPVKGLIQASVNAEIASAEKAMNKRVATLASDYQTSLGMAAAGINRGFFSDVVNPLKVRMWEELSALNIPSPHRVIDRVFKETAEDFCRVLVEKASELQAKPAEIRAELSKAIIGSNYIAVAEDEEEDMDDAEEFGDEMANRIEASSMPFGNTRSRITEEASSVVSQDSFATSLTNVFKTL